MFIVRFCYAMRRGGAGRRGGVREILLSGCMHRPAWALQAPPGRVCCALQIFVSCPTRCRGQACAVIPRANQHEPKTVSGKHGDGSFLTTTVKREPQPWCWCGIFSLVRHQGKPLQTEEDELPGLTEQWHTQRAQYPFIKEYSSNQ